MKEVHIK